MASESLAINGVQQPMIIPRKPKWYYPFMGKLEIQEPTLQGLSLENRNFERALFPCGSYVQTRFLDCNLSHCDFVQADLTHAHFERCQLYWTKLSDSILDSAQFCKGVFPQFSKCSMRGVSFIDFRGSPAAFVECDLTQAAFQRCRFFSPKWMFTFSRCNLEGASFANSHLSFVAFVDCNLGGVDFSNSFAAMPGFKESAISKNRFDQDTRWPME